MRITFLTPPKGEVQKQMERFRQNLFFIFLFFFPTQLGRHFWPEWSSVLGLRIDYLSPTFYLTDFFLFLIFLLYLPHFLSAVRKWLRQNHLWLWFAGGVFSLLFFGLAQSKVPQNGLYQLLKIAEYGFLVFYLFQETKSFFQLKKIILILSFGVIFESALALWQFLQQSSVGGIFWWFGERTFTGQTPGIAQAAINGELFLRPYGTFPHPNVLAGYLVVALILIIAVDFHTNWEKRIKWLAITLGSLTLFFTFSRIAWIVGFFVLVYWLLAQRKWLLFSLLAFFLILSAGSIRSRFQTLFTTDRQSFEIRQELNTAAIEMLKSRPFFGVGLGNFLVELPQFHQEKRAVRFLQPAHNVYLMVGAETGFLGLVTLMGFLFLTLRRLIRSLKQKNQKGLAVALSKKYNLSFAVAFFAVLFLALFDHYFYTLQQGQILLALVLSFSWLNLKKE